MFLHGRVRQQVERLEQDMGRIVAIESPELHVNIAALREREPLFGHEAYNKSPPCIGVDTLHGRS